MSMGKGSIVRKGEVVSSYEPEKEIAQLPPKPYRTITVPFQVTPGKYAVIPLLIGLQDQTSRYSIRLYFNCEPHKIQFYSQEPKIPVLDFIDRAQVKRARNPRFTSNSSSKSIASNPLTKKVMAPFTLDATFNTVKLPKARTMTIETAIAQNKQTIEQSGAFYEDNSKGSVSAQKKLQNSEDVIISQ